MKVVSELLQHLDTPHPWGWWDPPPTVVWEPVQCSQSPIPHFPAVLARWGGLGCKLANVTPLCKKGWKQNPWNYRLLSLTSVPGKVTEQLTPCQHVQDNPVTDPGGLCQPKSFCDWHRLEPRAKGMRFNTTECQVLPLGHTNLMDPSRLGKWPLQRELGVPRTGHCCP